MHQEEIPMAQPHALDAQVYPFKSPAQEARPTAVGTIDMQEFSELVRLIYAGPQERVPWTGALNRIRERLRANYVTLVIRPATLGDNGFMISVGEGTSAESTDLYNSHYAAMDPLVGLPSDHVVTVSEVMGYDAWLQSTFYQSFLKPVNVLHAMGADILAPGGAHCRFRVTRPHESEDFSAVDKAYCDLLLPHLASALQLHCQLGQLESLSQLFASTVDRLMVGTVFLDDQRRILKSNRVADEILAEGDGLMLVGGRLQAVFPTDNRQLQRFIKSPLCETNQKQPRLIEAMSVLRPSGLGSLGVVVRSIPIGEWQGMGPRPVLAVYLRDPEQKAQARDEIVRQLYDLTPAETALSMELVNGSSLDEAAEALHVRRNTARAHLRAIFSKTGVSRQTELVRLLLNSVLALGGMREDS